MPEEIQERCRQADITSKSMLLEIVRQSSVEDMHRLLDRIAEEGLTREDARRFKHAADASRPRRPRKYTYSYRPDDRSAESRRRRPGLGGEGRPADSLH